MEDETEDIGCNVLVMGAVVIPLVLVFLLLCGVVSMLCITLLGVVQPLTPL